MASSKKKSASPRSSSSKPKKHCGRGKHDVHVRRSPPSAKHPKGRKAHERCAKNRPPTAWSHFLKLVHEHVGGKGLTEAMKVASPIYKGAYTKAYKGADGKVKNISDAEMKAFIAEHLKK